MASEGAIGRVSVQSGTSPVLSLWHAGHMNHVDMRIALSTLWSCSAVAAGAVGLARSPAQWLAVALIAAVPPAIALHFSRAPIRTTSQDIQDVLR